MPPDDSPEDPWLAAGEDDDDDAAACEEAVTAGELSKPVAELKGIAESELIKVRWVVMSRVVTALENACEASDVMGGAVASVDGPPGVVSGVGRARLGIIVEVEVRTTTTVVSAESVSAMVIW